MKHAPVSTLKLLSRIASQIGIARLLSLVLLVAMISVRIWDPPPIESLRLRTFDFYEALSPRPLERLPVVIVDIDENSLRQLGQWPWPRTVVAQLVRQLNELGALVVGFDVVFAEPDGTSRDSIATSLPGLSESARLELQAMPNNDEVFAQAIRKARVALGQSGLGDTKASNAATGDLPATAFAINDLADEYLIEFPSLLRNIAVLEKAASGRGMISILPDRDGVVRRVPLVMKAGGIVAPSLSLELLRLAARASTIVVHANEGGLTNVRVAGLTIPTNENGQLWIRFGRHDLRRFVSAVDIISGRTPRDMIEGKLVLVGTSAVGLLDTKTVPVDRTMPGVEVHAQVIESVLENALLSTPNYSIVIELAATILVSLGILIFGPIIGAMRMFNLGACAAAAIAATSWHEFRFSGLLFDPTFPLLCTASVYFTMLAANYASEEAGRKRIRSAFGRYLAPALVEELAKSPERLVLGGQEKRMTFLLSDVRGFAKISETYKHDPQGLTKLMNRLLTPLTNTILAMRGTVDKYMGDAIMAFWNAPLDDDNHEYNACKAAVDMLEAIARLNEELRHEAEAGGHKFSQIRLGIGLNTGVCVVGNLGSDQRFDYSVLGDPVNLASRLEGQTKSYDLPILMGSETARIVGGRLPVLEIDRLRVVGKSEPETIFTLLGDDSVASSAEYKELVSAHDEVLSEYRACRWDEAERAIERARALGRKFGLESVYRMYEGRIAEMRTSPPELPWDGVAVALTK